MEKTLIVHDGSYNWWDVFVEDTRRRIKESCFMAVDGDDTLLYIVIFYTL